MKPAEQNILYRSIRQTANLPGIICLILFICFGYPIMFCFSPGLKTIPTAAVQAATTTVMFAYIVCKNNLKYQPYIIVYVAVQAATATLYLIIHQSPAYISQIGTYIFSLIAYLYIVNILTLEKFAKYYCKCIMWISVCGVIAFFCVFLFNLQPLFEYTNLDTRPGYFFYLTYTNSYIFNTIRYSGIFDEPGAMAFWGVFAIIINRLWDGSKRLEKVLIICLCFTFSLAYYIQLTIWILARNIRNIKVLLLMAVSLTALYIGLASLKGSDEYHIIYLKTVGRLQTKDSGELAGDNRSDLMEVTKPVFLQSPIFGEGADRMARLSEANFMGANPYTPLARDGIVGLVSIYGFFFVLLLFALKKKEYLLYILILALGFAQRPSDLKLFTTFMYIILFASFIHNYKSSIGYDIYNYNNI